MTSAVWILMVVTHVNSGSSVAFEEFDNKQACDAAAVQIRVMGESVNARCVSKSGALQ
jgi:hypothetical protein